MQVSHHTIRNQGAEIFYSVAGAGPDVILLHATPTSHEMWLPVAELLSANYRSILIDLRGHGRSSVGEGVAVATMQLHAADVEAVCRDAQVKTAAFAGISIGGYVLFEVWRRTPGRMRAMALCDTRAGADNEAGRATRRQTAAEVLERGVEGFIESMVPKLLGESTRRNRKDIVEQARHTMRFSKPQGMAAVQLGMAERPDSNATLATIKAPALVLHGDEDTLVPLAEAEQMHRQIAGSRMQVIPRVGHLSVLEDPAAAAGILRAFLDSLRDSSGSRNPNKI